ncbi:GDSL-type esterase/lipase family protein [Lapillicoccus jejuensis]|uniref:Lysophospholipase L1-like esterase n=1 Tax=Lapillicoccus jejuensis TaxID=402171 RepID=A0A542DXQ8_9MICO|nr:GDSL-type esterase/lipase family protein [Lapillicoccus jejuensis]TQJ07714.1 lysophospholipase L1-like esterase [Lapillicoccus jejuensis]
MADPFLPAAGTLVLVGDSVTDAGRDRTDPGGLGEGWVRDVAAALATTHPGLAVRNRGVAGDRAVDLERRWDDDVLAERPVVVSVLVGVNDTWRRFDAADPTSVEDYEATLRRLLERTRLAGVERLVLVEPFALHVPPVTSEWDDELAGRRAAVARVGASYGAVVVRAQAAFDAAAGDAPEALLHDGVHPTPAGHALLARSWLDAVGA